MFYKSEFYKHSERLRGMQTNEVSVFFKEFDYKNEEEKARNKVKIVKVPFVLLKVFKY